jgi:hypothetical protein
MAGTKFSRNNVRMGFLLEAVVKSTLDGVGYLFENIHPWSEILQ